MRTKVWTVAALPALVSIFLNASTARAEQPAKPATRPTVQVADRSLRTLGDTARDGRAATRAKISPASEPVPAPAPPSDPYGFGAILNSYRASVGLPPLEYDANLSNWASHNNAAQCRRGLGHHVLPNCFQNSGWNYPDAWSVAQGWMNSPGHRENMLTPSATRFGIAYGPGPYWTLNAQ